LHNEYIARKKRREKFDKAAPYIQKIVRGFLGITNMILILVILILLLFSTTW